MKLFSKTFLIVSILSATTNVYAQNFVNQIQDSRSAHSRAVYEDMKRIEQERYQRQQEYLEQQKQREIQQREEIERDRELSLQRYKAAEALQKEIALQQEKERIEQERQEKIRQEEEAVRKEFEDFAEFYPSNQIKVKGRCIDETKCHVIEYYEEGALKSELNYKGGLKQIEGQTAWYGDCTFEDSGYSISYGDTKENGVCTDYYENGEIKLKRTCVYGICTSLGYYENGNQQKEEHYKLKRKDGVQKTYYASGALQAENNYKNGKLEGLQKTYYESGNIKSEGNYKDDKLDGIQKEYYKTGALHTETNFKDGRKDGTEKRYSESKTLLIEANYKRGEKDGIQKEYHDNGTIKLEGRFIEGKKYGIHKEYYESIHYGPEKLKRETSYKNDKKDGTEKEYFESGALHIEANFKDDFLDGVKKEYNESGNLISEANYKNGKVQGVVVEYSEDGKWKFVNVYNYLKYGMLYVYDILKYCTLYVYNFIKTYSVEVSVIILALLLLWGIFLIAPWVERVCIKAKNSAITKANNTKVYVKNKSIAVANMCKETKDATKDKLIRFKSYTKDKFENSSNISHLENLEKLAELKDEGVLNEEEFLMAKNKLLNEVSSSKFSMHNLIHSNLLKVITLLVIITVCIFFFPYEFSPHLECNQETMKMAENLLHEMDINVRFKNPRELERRENYKKCQVDTNEDMRMTYEIKLKDNEIMVFVNPIGDAFDNIDETLIKNIQYFLNN